MKRSKRTIKLTLTASVLALASTGLLTGKQNDPEPVQAQATLPQEPNPEFTEQSEVLSKSKPINHLPRDPEPVQVSAVVRIATPVQIAGPTEILQENYAEEENLDEILDDEAFAEAQRLRKESMTEAEIEVRAQIDRWEAELNTADTEQTPVDSLLAQLEPLLQIDDGSSLETEPGHQLLDLQCAASLCRMTVEVEDEYGQYEILDRLPQQIEWMDRSFADILIKADDRRVLTVYLTRLDTPENET